MTLLPRSLAFRAITFSTLWAVAALIVITTIISTLYRQASERGFESLLSAHLFNLIGSIGVSDQGALQGAPELGDLRFSEPYSGWYWEVIPVTSGLTGRLRSTSMFGDVPSASIAAAPFDRNFNRSYQIDGLKGERLQVLENEFVLDPQNHVARFRMMGNRSDLEAEIRSFARTLYGYLALFGGGMIGINAIAILLGLRPLARVRAALARVREGAAQRLDGIFPPEIQPLVNETNALIENNRRIVERSRTQVGNLAHSLKTPVAVLLNEGRAIGGERGRVVLDQASAMKKQVDHYLQRASIAAQRDSVVFRAPARECVQRLTRVMTKLNPEKSVSLHLPERELMFAGEREDLEDITGNLMENAFKWASSRVAVTVRELLEPGAPDQLELIVEDDGPGIPEDKAREALKRGRRLDETTPGTGLGLAIVAELVAEYGGRLLLERSALGGVQALVRLRTVK